MRLMWAVVINLPDLLIYDEARMLHILQAQVCDCINTENDTGN